MHTRATWVQAPPEKVEQLTANFKERVIPAAQQAKGFVGAALLYNPDTQLASGITIWESARALAESEQVGIATRVQSASETAARIVNVERGEVVVMDRAAPPQSTGYCRSNFAYCEPEKLDELIALIKDKALTILRQQKGYRSTWMTVDRSTGQTTIMTVWDSAAEREASNAAISPSREEAARLMGSAVRVELSEQLVAEVPSPAGLRV